jgi:hypothetical protein
MEGGVAVQLVRRGFLLLVAFLAIAQPASADSSLAGQEAQVKQRLAAVSAATSDVDQRIGALERSIADTNVRIDRERAQLRMLARSIYAQPASPLLSIFSASSLADAMTRFTDLSAAGERAVATKRALSRDLSALQQQKAGLEADRQRDEQLREDLEAQFRRLDRELSLQAAAPAVPVASGQIQQLILDAFAPMGAGAQAWALRVARCESNYNPLAVNRYSGASGLFQFLPSTWAHTPYASQSVFDPAANSQAAAWYYNATGRTGGPWSCK